MSTSSVVARSGATVGSLYHHFPGGKAELAVAAVQASGEAVELSLRRALNGQEVGSGLQRWIEALADRLDQNPLLGCPVAPAATEAAFVDDGLRTAAAAAFDRWGAVIADALGTRVTPAGDTAVAVLSLVEGALLLSRAQRSSAPLRAVLPAVRAVLAAA